MSAREVKETSIDCTRCKNHLWLHRKEAEFKSQMGLCLFPYNSVRPGWQKEGKTEKTDREWLLQNAQHTAVVQKPEETLPGFVKQSFNFGPYFG